MTREEYEYLSDQQKRNINALRIKKALINKRYGNKIQIVTTEDDVINQGGALAIPTNSLRDVPMEIKLKLETIDPATGTIYSSDLNSGADFVDVSKELEKMADKLDPDGIAPAPKKQQNKINVVAIPSGYKLVKEPEIEDTELIIDYPEDKAVTKTIGRTVSRVENHDLSSDDMEFLKELMK